ncbi:flagellar motor switch protein FliG [Meridianimarinicoccus roseus]|uniref:Flagellar motor switch protein FliG n=1 Tax=Meridianimarinicoccus roseus TaxID=2072018 RepID=A0A2V2LD92_9RHOB|nr:FliG C-terminal domain-containing protein [Meridianimarinicoccus roseus]PWR03032.1 flagellar motor switch protein FliG [Meridianimarinicoccus roseus]
MPSASMPRRPALSRRQKAAIIVRLMLKEGANLKLDALPEAMQIELTHEMGAIRTIDRDTLHSVIEEFMADVNDLGVAFPGGLEGALEVLDGALSAANLRRIRRETGVVVAGDPWEMINRLPVEDLAAIVQRESTEIAAVILSKLPVATSALLLGQVPADIARRITYAVSHTEMIDPETVRTIGHAIASQVAEESPRAFDDAPVNRIGAILNSSRSETREGVLVSLEEQDAELSAKVRKTIFTFANVSQRVEARDIPKVTRAVDQATLITALASADETDGDAADFILNNMSQRMAAQLREDMGERGKVKPTEADEAKARVIAAIRDLEQAGELSLIDPEE